MEHNNQSEGQNWQAGKNEYAQLLETAAPQPELTEEEQRAQSLEAMHKVSSELAKEMGERPEQRINWLMTQTPESFGKMLVDINATARVRSAEGHTFDGENVKAGTVGGSVPPDQEDKVELLAELVYKSQAFAARQLEQGSDAQSVMDALAVAMPTVVNKLHLFNNGNGRTSRMLRMVLRDGGQITPDKVDGLVNKNTYSRYDTTPAGPVEKAVMHAMQMENRTENTHVVDDVTADDDDLIEDELNALKNNIPNLSDEVIRTYEDQSNFNETLRLLAQSKGAGGGAILLREVMSSAAEPEGLDEFKAAYRYVRKQRVELLMQGLLGEKELPLPEDNGRGVNQWINTPRRFKGEEPIDPATIRTARDLQVAYDCYVARIVGGNGVPEYSASELEAGCSTQVFASLDEAIIAMENAEPVPHKISMVTRDLLLLRSARDIIEP